LYNFVLFLHSVVRWLVLLAGLGAAIRAALGWLNSSDWTPLDNRLSLGFLIGVDVQTLLGLTLYLFLSPITKSAFRDFAAALASDEIRFFAVDHFFLMTSVLLLAHAGRLLPKRATEAAQKHKKAFILFGIAVAAMLIAIPWNRPLLPLR